MQNKRKIIAIKASLLIMILIIISLLYFNTQENNVEIKSSLKAYNAELQENEHMHLEVDSSGDKVPVPNGYVGSKVAGENEIDTGYVIYEGTEEVNSENVEEAQKTRNQYVWIPVPDVSKMYGTDANGKKWGKLYNFTTETGEGIDPVTGAKPLNWSESDGVITILDKNSYREPEIAIKYFDLDNNLKNLNMEMNKSHEFLMQLEKEFDNMLNSIEKYGGFYIGRYESGDLSKEKVVTKKGNTDISNQSWYTMYNKCKTLKAENVNIETGLIWGNQYDRVLMWLIESGNKTKEEISIDSTGWANYRSSTFEYINTNNEKVIKGKDGTTRIPTGSTEYTIANNIYDLAGNVYDSTMEVSFNNTFSKDFRIIRGGGYYNTKTASFRDDTYQISDKYGDVGCRAMLYIK